MKRIGWILICLIWLLASGVGVRADLPASEAALKPTGSAFEINADDQGILWITDYQAGEVWGLDPDSGDYDVYSVGGKPSDARFDGAYLWWADAVSNILGRVSTQGAYTRWDAPPGVTFFGTALDGLGRFWAIDDSEPMLYRLDPAGPDELCTYSLPNGGMSNYLLHVGNDLWLGDYVNERLLRLSILADTVSYTWWSLPLGSEPYGMASDGQGGVWYTDSSLNRIAHLDLHDVAHIRVYGYALPVSSSLILPAILGERIWYTDIMQASVGELDPLHATPTDFEPETGTGAITPACEEDISYSTGDISITPGHVDWNAVGYPVLTEANGWRIYQLPDPSSPWGIAGTDAIYFVDNGRKVLGRIPPRAQVTACKFSDADGDLGTQADQEALPGWGMTLYSGTTLMGTAPTGEDGCVSWDNLETGVPYNVVEETREGWQALTPVECDLGVISAPGTSTCNFINWHNQVSLFLPLVKR